LEEAKQKREERLRREAEFVKDMINVEDEAAANEEEDKRKAAEAESKRKAQEDEAKLQAEAEARQLAEAKAQKLAEEAKWKADEEAASQKGEEEAKQRAAAEEAKKRAEEEEQRKALEESIRASEAEEERKEAEEEAKRKAEEAARLKAAEEVKRALEERQKQEEEARLKALESVNPAEAQKQRRRAEMKAKMAAALERKRLLLEKKKKAEEAAYLKQTAAERELRQRAEEEAAKRKAEEDELRRKKEEEDARVKAEQEARLRAEEERKRQEEEKKRREEEAQARRIAAAELMQEKKVIAASSVFEAEKSEHDQANKASITLRLQDSHGKSISLKVQRAVKFRVMMNSACARLGLMMADAQFFHGGRQLKPNDTPESFGVGDNDIIKVDDFIKVDDLIAEEETKDEDAAAKAAREFFENAQRAWEGAKPKEAVVLTAEDQAKLDMQQKTVEAKWSAEVDMTVQKLPPLRSAEEARRKAVQVVKLLSEEDKANLLYGSHGNQPGWYVSNIGNISRLGVPALRIQDSSYRFKKLAKGVQKTVTCWPSSLALAATWDGALVSRVAAAMGTEWRGKGANLMLGPSLGVLRVAAAGRNFEQLSGEDPYLGSRLVQQFVKGAQSAGVMVGVKTLGFDHQETNRKKLNVEVDSRVAWELYYPPFEAAVQAGAAAVMCSASKVNGTAVCENDSLLKRDLKDTMGFKGFVLSEENVKPGALNKGLDMILPGTTDDKVRFGQFNSVNANVTNDAATRVLTSLYRSRLDEFPEWMPYFGQIAQASNQRTEAHATLAREAAINSVTLLKNDLVLPLDPSVVKTLAVLGVAAGAPAKVSFTAADYYSGGGSSHVPATNANDMIPLTQITKRAKEANMRVVSCVENNLTRAKALSLTADLVVVVAATTSTEGVDRPSLALDDNADQLIAAVAGLKPTVVLMQTPGVVLTPWRKEVAAIANLFLAGEGTGSAWAAMLFGDASPAGKLPVVFPESEVGIIRPGQEENVRYEEGLLTSYRSGIAAAFPFGHGLSYTQFTYSEPEVVSRGCQVQVCLQLDISNSGERAGVEVVQAYLSFSSGEDVVYRALRGFQKTSLLQPGERERVILAFRTRDLSTYHVDAGWVEKSNVKVEIGSSSSDIRQTTWVNVNVG